MKLTTAFLTSLDRQDVFDTVAWQLLRQNARAFAPDGVKCMYRAPDGKRCGVGWLIPDDVYHESLEFLGVRDLAEQLAGTHFGATFARFLTSHMSLLRDFQEMHDARQPNEWPVALRVIAQHHRLDASVVSHCERQFGRPLFVPSPVAPAYLLDLDAIAKLKPIHTGVDHGSEERAEAREVCGV